MTRRTVDNRIITLKVLDLLQQIGIYRTHHPRHLSGDLLRRLVLLFPRVRNMTVRTVYTERSAVTRFHHHQESICRHCFENFDVLEDFRRGLILFSRDALSQVIKSLPLVEVLVVLDLRVCFRR